MSLRSLGIISLTLSLSSAMLRLSSFFMISLMKWVMSRIWSLGLILYYRFISTAVIFGFYSHSRLSIRKACFPIWKRWANVSTPLFFKLLVKLYAALGLLSKYCFTASTFYLVRTEPAARLLSGSAAGLDWLLDSCDRLSIEECFSE